MQTQRQVICVSAGMLKPKKSDNVVSRSNMYLNYGLLGLASVLSEKDWIPTVVHGHFEDPSLFIDQIFNANLLPTEAPLLLSIPSSFALEWTRKFCKILKDRWPEQLIIIGGRWVTANDAAWLRSQVPDVDLVVFGTAESTIHDLMFPTRWKFTPGTELCATESISSASPALNYRLLKDHREFTPSFEVSRGCGRGCNFCAEATAKLSPMKPASSLVKEIGDAIEVYGTSDIRAYFEASLFQPSSTWIQDFESALKSAGIVMRWRTETRMDNITPAQIGALARTGLAVLDLGLETASPRQILAMEKSTNPIAYLRKAGQVLEACKLHGVWAKVNILIYPGETIETLSETIAWLEEHRANIRGVSVGTTIVFRFNESSAEYLKSLASLGATPVIQDALDLHGYAHLHISQTMTHAEAQSYAQSISKSFMSERDYFDLKSFSYLPRSLTFEEFVESAKDLLDSDLSYRR
jgi:hypothetical protein